MNKVILVGRLTRDPQIYYSQGENSQAVARYTLAVDRRFRRQQDGQQNNNQQTADFIGCVAFGRQAEFAEKYLHQGTKIVLEGRIQTGRYTNKEGQTVYTTDVIAENQEFAESKAASQAGAPAGGYTAAPQQPRPASNPAPAPAPQAGGASAPAEESADGFMNLPEGIDEELPFQ
ncbi:MAG: single-stranded DNA-binding protein [Eubacteriales bacterium]|jgi:single-strand DNA-binding protein